MGVSIGDTCKLYKKCKICGEYKYLREFRSAGGKKNNFSRRKSYCRSYDKAKRLVEEQAAGIVNSTLIHHFFNQKSFKEFILARDNYTCHYCSFYGDTVDHKMPRSQGGLSTPGNCVCACFNCNQHKNEIIYEDYIDTLH